MMPYTIVKATKTHMAEIDQWLKIEQDDYDAACEMLETSGNDAPYPIKGFWCNWDSVKRGWSSGNEVFVLIVDNQAIGFHAGTDILEIKPDYRGKGYGKILAESMMLQEYNAGRCVVTIQIAPSSAEAFWVQAMDFKLRPENNGQLNSTFAYKVLNRNFSLGTGTRVQYSVKFYKERLAYQANPMPFSIFNGEGELLPDGSIQLTERAYCFCETDYQHQDYFVSIDIAGVRFIFDKVKRAESEQLGIRKDKNGVYYVDLITPCN